MSVRAKFKVDRIEEASDGCKTIRLSAVYDANPESENGKFFKWTPSASISLSTINPVASSQFEEGKEVYVDFTPI